MTLRQKILSLLTECDAQTDRELADRLLFKGAPQQSINQTCKKLETQRLVERKPDASGKIRNTLVRDSGIVVSVSNIPMTVLPETAVHSEDWIKAELKKWLEKEGWSVKIAWG